jgi:hypothetical protein
MKKTTTVLAVLWVLSTCGSAAADHRLTVEIQRKSYDTQLEHFTNKPDLGEKNLATVTRFETTILLGRHRARIDRGEVESWIFLGDENKLIHVHHDERHFEVFPLPVHLTAYLDAGQRARVADRTAKLKPKIGVDTTGEVQQVGAWKAQRVVLRIHHAGEGEREIDLWLTEDLKLDLTPYRDLVLARSQVYPWHAEWARAEMDLPGFPVLWRMEYRVGTVRLLDSRRLLSLEEIEPGPDSYAPPADYLQVAKPLSDWPR